VTQHAYLRPQELTLEQTNALRDVRDDILAEVPSTAVPHSYEAEERSKFVVTNPVVPNNRQHEAGNREYVGRIAPKLHNI